MKTFNNFAKNPIYYFTLEIEIWTVKEKVYSVWVLKAQLD